MTIIHNFMCPPFNQVHENWICQITRILINHWRVNYALNQQLGGYSFIWYMQFYLWLAPDLLIEEQLTLANHRDQSLDRTFSPSSRSSQGSPCLWCPYLQRALWRIPFFRQTLEEDQPESFMQDFGSMEKGKTAEQVLTAAASSASDKEDAKTKWSHLNNGLKTTLAPLKCACATSSSVYALQSTLEVTTSPHVTISRIPHRDHRDHVVYDGTLCLWSTPTRHSRKAWDAQVG